MVNVVTETENVKAILKSALEQWLIFKLEIVEIPI